MTRCRSTFRKGDVRKAVEAVAKATGAARVEVVIRPDGTMIVKTDGNPADTDNNGNEWDKKYGST
jgi:hypothetical protein